MGTRRSGARARARARTAIDQPRRSAIGLIVLAAGHSTRMRRPKQTLPLAPRRADGTSETLLRHAARAAVEALTRPIVVVLGADADALLPQLANLPVHALAHAGSERGIGSSIKAGLDGVIALAPATDAVIVSVCDQPHLTPAVFSRLGRAYRGSDSLVVASAYGGIAGVPALFDRAVFSELQALRDDEGAREIITRDDERLRTVPFPLGAVDLDTPEEYEAYLRSAGADAAR